MRITPERAQGAQSSEIAVKIVIIREYLQM